jgi:hypothetical protein
MLAATIVSAVIASCRRGARIISIGLGLVGSAPADWLFALLIKQAPDAEELARLQAARI